METINDIFEFITSQIVDIIYETSLINTLFELRKKDTLKIILEKDKNCKLSKKTIEKIIYQKTKTFKKNAVNKKDLFGKYLIFGLGFLLIFQTLLNLCVVTGIIPITGVTLPFISYGGSSLLSYMFIIGLILRISHDNYKYIN